MGQRDAVHQRRGQRKMRGDDPQPRGGHRPVSVASSAVLGALRVLQLGDRFGAAEVDVRRVPAVEAGVGVDLAAMVECRARASSSAGASRSAEASGVSIIGTWRESPSGPTSRTSSEKRTKLSSSAGAQSSALLTSGRLGRDPALVPVGAGEVEARAAHVPDQLVDRPTPPHRPARSHPPIGVQPSASAGRAVTSRTGATIDGAGNSAGRRRSR